MFVKDSRSPMYTGEDKEQSEIGPLGVPNEVNGVSTRYASEAFMGAAFDLGIKGGYNKLNHGLLFGLPGIKRIGKPGMAFQTMYETNLRGNLPFVAANTLFNLGSAPKGRKAGSAIGGIIGVTGAETMGTLLGGPLGGTIAAMFLAKPIQDITERTVGKFIDAGRDLTRVHMGGGYEDSQIAYTMRQKAAQEIGKSLMNARQHLGSEAMLTHQ